MSYFIPLTRGVVHHEEKACVPVSPAPSVNRAPHAYSCKKNFNCHLEAKLHLKCQIPVLY